MKVVKLASILTGVVMAASVGLASAGQPLQLTEQQLDNVTAGWGWHHHRHHARSTAYADAVAEAYGRRNSSSTWTGTFTAPGASSAASNSYSCSGYRC